MHIDRASLLHLGNRMVVASVSGGKDSTALALLLREHAEVTRVCTLGDRNACTMLLSACRRGAAALGYHRVVTYTLSSEPGTSLRAAGWQETAQVRGRSWDCASRPRTASTPRNKRRWEAPGSERAVRGAAVDPPNRVAA